MLKNKIISKNLFFFTNKKNLSDLFEEIENIGIKNDIISGAIKKDLLEREKEVSTNMGNGIAIPHCRSEKILFPKVIIGFLDEPIKYDDTDNLVSYIFCILVPSKSESLHLTILSKISELLLDENFVCELKERNLSAIEEKINFIANDIKDEENINDIKEEELKFNNKNLNSNKTNINNFNTLKIVAVTSCPTGVAHTHMVAKALENAAKKLNYQIKVEKQAAEGTINGLTFEDIKEADVVIIASDKFVDKKRFVGKKVYEVSMRKVLQNATLEIESSFEKGSIYRLSESDKSDNIFKKRKSKTRSGIMGYLMNGVSYMLPLVIAGGLLIAISAPFINENTYGKYLKAHAYVLYQILSSFSQIGGLAFTIMIPVLAGFIAVAIADRIALAPAMILAFCANFADPKSQNSVNPFLFDWQKLDFGLDRGELGYIGAIFIGPFVGYFCLILKKVKWPQFILPLIPIMIVPLIVVIFGWLVLAFILSAPIFYLQEGINNSITYLQKHELIFLLGILLGFLIAIDMGGPLNKIAFFFGVSSITADGGGAVMGMDASVIAVPPLGAFFAWFFGRRYFDEEDAAAGKNALALGFMGITEGAIPFAVKYPKFIISNVIGGMVAASISGILNISDAAAHGGIIVYILGAIGKVHSGHLPSSNYAWGAFHLVAILIGSSVTGMLNILFRHLQVQKEDKKVVKTIPVLKKFKFKKA